jgi:hypothetical protein
VTVVVGQGGVKMAAGMVGLELFEQVVMLSPKILDIIQTETRCLPFTLHLFINNKEWRKRKERTIG